MSQVKLDLPEALQTELQARAEREGLALEQLIVDLLGRLTAFVDLERQRTTFEQLVTRYSEEEAEAALREVLAART